ncbi:MAG: GGDEF domain-containing protein [Gammaproteobacteria bacterium]|nr:GGDEF domain-containing protein [Gammaproteobacteria bacterium]
MNCSFWQRFLKIFIPMSLMAGALLAIFFFQSVRTERMASALKDEALLEQARLVAAHLFRDKITDLMILAEGESLQRFLHGDNNGNSADLAREFATFSKHKVNYDQIRFIDLEGNEKIRVNHNSGSPVIVPGAMLQNKFHRYYFTDSVKLRKREVFISPLDLNIEQKRIEIPFKPMIRLSTPVFDNRGDKKGVLVVNYSAQELLDHLQEIIGDGDFSMLNKDGHLLLGGPVRERWGFMFGRQASFPTKHPQAWNMMAMRQNGSIEHDSGSYLYATVSPLADALNVDTRDGSNSFLLPSGQANHIHWKLISSSRTRDSMAFRDKATFYMVLCIPILLVVTIFALIFSRLSVQKCQALCDLERLANTDALTGVASRRRFVAESEAEFARAKRYGRELAVIMLDADHFKSVNDTFGHAAGDEVLQQLAGICQGAVREQDLLARYGGEEFIMLLPESDLDGAFQLAERIRMLAASSPLQTAAGEVAITVSIGVSVISRKDDGFDHMLNRADKAMYNAKLQGRNMVCVKQGQDSRASSELCPPDGVVVPG